MPTATAPVEWTPPKSPWQVEAKDLTCLRYLNGDEHTGKPPMRIGLPTVLSVIAGTLELTREHVEEQLRLGLTAYTKSSRYILDPQQLAIAGTRRAV